MSRCKRLQKELKDIRKNQYDFFILEDKIEDLFKWNVTLLGPENTPYEGGVFFITITFPSDYPFKPPQIRFNTKIFHPQIQQNYHSEIICTSCGRWSPALTVVKILHSLESDLKDPELIEHCNTEYYELTKGNRELYEKIAKEWTHKYAK